MVTIGVQDAEVFQLIKQIQARGDDMKPVMTVISGIMHDEVEENFSVEGKPRWPALAPATIIAREKAGHWPGKMLQVTGRLAASMSQRATATQAIVGTNDKRARLLFLGGQAGRGHKVYVPGRNPLKLRSSTVGKIKMELMQYLFKRQ